MEQEETGHAGLVSFASSLLSVGTGLLFSVVVARRLAVTEYGVWQYYSVVIGYLSLPGSIVGFWLTRELGRGKAVLHTGLSFCGILSAASSLLLMGISLFSDPSVRLSADVLAAIALCLILTYISNSLDAAVSGVSPVLYGVGRSVLEITKVATGLFLVVTMRMGLLGAILSINAALGLKSLVVYLRIPKDKGGQVDLSTGVSWLKRWWIPTIAAVPSLISSLDLVVLTLATGSTVSTAYLGLSKTVSAIVGFSSLLAISLYSGLLGGGGRKRIEEAVRLVFLFAIPMTAGLVSLTLPIVHLFGSVYAPSALATQLLSIAALFIVVRDLSVVVIQGTEVVDNKKDASLAEFVRSGLVVPHAVQLGGYGAYIMALIIAMNLLGASTISPENMATTTAFINLAVTAPMSILIWRLSKKSCQYRTPWGDIAKYAFATLVMLMVLWITYPVQAVSVMISDVLAGLIPVVAIGAVTYFAVLIAIDGRTRNAVREMYATLLRRGRGSPSRMNR